MLIIKSLGKHRFNYHFISVPLLFFILKIYTRKNFIFINIYNILCNYLGIIIWIFNCLRSRNFILFSIKLRNLIPRLHILYLILLALSVINPCTNLCLLILEANNLFLCDIWTLWLNIHSNRLSIIFNLLHPWKCKFIFNLCPLIPSLFYFIFV